MTNAEKQISAKDQDRVSARITELEANTDAEVVCAVATESGRYDRAESIGGLFVGIVALVIGNKMLASHGWDSGTNLPLGWQVALIVVGFVIGNLLASYCHPVRRLLVSRKEIEVEVNRRAHQLFSRHGIGTTRHRGGMLIFLSLFEHRLEILCDKTIADELSQKDLDAVRDALLPDVAKGRLADGLIAGLDQAEKRLSEILPASDEATTALPNKLLLFHPRP